MILQALVQYYENLVKQNKIAKPGWCYACLLYTSKDPKLEEKEAVIQRIHEAEKYVPLEQLSISPQCGFASTEEGNLLTEEEQWNKLKLIKEIA